MQSKSIYRDEGDLVDYPEEEEEIKETKSRSEMIASMGQRYFFVFNLKLGVWVIRI